MGESSQNPGAERPKGRCPAALQTVQRRVDWLTRQAGSWPRFSQPVRFGSVSEMNPMQPTRRDRMGLKGGVLGAALVLMAPLAWATPPSFTGNAITMPYPEIGQSVTVNLRQLN